MYIALCHHKITSSQFFIPQLTKLLSIQIISTAVCRVALPWTAVKELTCKYIVVVVDVVEFDPFIQDMKLICSQDLSLPVRVPWIKTDHTSNTQKSDSESSVDAERPLTFETLWARRSRLVTWHFLHLLSHVYGLRTEAPPFRQTPLLLLRELWCHNSGESLSWSHGMFLVAKKQDRGKPEGLDEKDASL